MKIEEAAAIYQAGEQMKAYLATREGRLLVQDLAERNALTEGTIRHGLYAAALDIPFDPQRAKASILAMWRGQGT